MKRVIHILLVAFLFQMSWNVAAAYCMHESGRASEHFGHHSHTHEADDSEPGKQHPKKSIKSGLHADCASCTHHHGAVVFPSAPDQPALVAADRGLSDLLSVALPTPFLGQPERPQWHGAA